MRAEVEDAAEEIRLARDRGGRRGSELDTDASANLPAPLFAGVGVRVIDHSRISPAVEEAKASLIETGERATPPPPPELDSLMARDQASLQGSMSGRGARGSDQRSRNALSVRDRVAEEFRATRGTWDAYDTHAVRPGMVVRELSEGRLRATYGPDIDAETDRRISIARHARKNSALALQGITRRAVRANREEARSARETLAARRVRVFALAGVPREDLTRSEVVEEQAAALLRHARRSGLPSIT